MGKGRKRKGFIRRHSLSVVSVGVLIMWIVLYSVSSPSTHTGSFFGNAIADWTGCGSGNRDKVFIRERLVRKPTSTARSLESHSRATARPFPQHFSFDHGNWMDCPLCLNGL